MLVVMIFHKLAAGLHTQFMTDRSTLMLSLRCHNEAPEVETLRGMSGPLDRGMQVNQKAVANQTVERQTFMQQVLSNGFTFHFWAVTSIQIVWCFHIQLLPFMFLLFLLFCV